ncbi:MAG: DUF4304 domain-containing protein [Planctomycetaceae bacterium]
MKRRSGIQKRALEALLPMGFIKVSGTTFARQVGRQLQFVGLQYRQFCDEFTFNLGCHFLGIPSMLTYKSVKLSEMEELDSGLCCRVGNYVGDGSHDIWWSLDSSQISAAWEQAVAAIECAFEDCIQKWGPDGKLLLESHVRNRVAAIRLSRHLQKWMLGKGSFERFAFVALLAHYHGDLELAQTFYERALSRQESIIVPHVPKLASALGITNKPPSPSS